MPLVGLADTLRIVADGDAPDAGMIVLKPAGGELYALLVDVVHDHEELVIKPAAPAVMATGLYAGTTIADDGSPILLLDPSGIAAASGVLLDSKQADKIAASPDVGEESQANVPALLFRTLDGRRRAIRLGVVERIEDVPPQAIEYSAGRLRVAIGEAILPLAGCEAAPTSPLRLLRLTDGATELAYGFGEVIDIVALSGDAEPAAGPGEVSGVTLVNGEQVELLDPYWLFAAHCDSAPAAATRPVCAIPAADPWMANILRPILESAGYRVVSSDQADAADIIIETAGGVAAPIPASADVLKLRAKQERAHESDDSIYRYDRAGLLAALESRVASRRKG
jgi:two-component system chemotaxis sensor kinase CheA